ncbi:matrixin family metalloprotease [Ornithinibacillus contaminans]|uniref:matrixin family metalloprotease n=1 Tax=Ornithinibacillus contaminans TaxID=694055 RepID=UPI00064DAEDE|nr:matrixin family metalloprotease [Ornithinibacillus contaminans]
MKKTMLFFTLILLLIFLSVNPVSAHFMTDRSKHSVDNGEIRWGTYHGSTKWTSARNTGITQWDNEGIINIAGDTTSTVEDLSFTDYSASDGVLGSWQKYTGADRIRFNNNYFNNMSACERNKTALHELGHALNLDHNNVAGSVMKSGYICQNFLGAHDKSDLKERW